MKNIKKLLSIVLIIITMLILLCSCGPKIKNGFVNEKGYTYYYDNNEMWTGRKEIDGDWYYFGQIGAVPPEQVGAMCKNFAMGYEGNDETYYYGSDGKMVKNKFVVINGKKFYCGNDGKMLHDAQKEINGKIYNFDSNGVAKEEPYYSVPAPMGGVYNFYLKNTFPLILSYYSWTTKHGKWVIKENPTIEVYGNSVTISGIVEYQNTSEMNYVNFDCRLSSTDENGITDSVVGRARSAEIRGGEKTRFEVKFNESLPLIGRDIYIEFIAFD